MKKIISLLLVMLMVLSMAACGTTAKTDATVAPTEAPVVSETEAPTEASAYPMTLTDMAGREVTIEAEPQKIVSGYYISSSACIALGLEDKIVAVEDKSDKRPIYKLAAPAILEMPTVGTAKEFNLEACLATEPDLVILPMKQKDTAAALEELGIPALVVLPESHEQIQEMFTLIATAAGVPENAEALITYYNGVLDEIAALTADIAEEDKPVVFMGGTSAYLRTAPAEMYQASLITAAGGVNAAGDIEGSNWVDISYEQLLAWDPDYIILASDASYTVEDVLNDANLSGLKAVVNGCVYQLPSKAEAWDSPVPGGILGSVWLAEVLHPELFTEAEPAAVIDEYYETFYQFTYSENE